MTILEAIISTGMIIGLFVIAYGCVWVLQKLWDKRNDNNDIAI